jgi:hypothetical protein
LLPAAPFTIVVMNLQPEYSASKPPLVPFDTHAESTRPLDISKGALRT